MSPVVMRLHSERYAPTGNIASEGIGNQLGRPRLDKLTVLVREAVQNCWDAKAPHEAGVRVAFDLFSASPEQRRAWRERVFADAPANLDIHAGLDDMERSWRVLAISDRGTTGLGGPTRADVLPEDGEATDFVDFLRNLGQPPDKQLGGGTFGFGKAALYACSHVQTILVHTRCQVAGRTRSRLIAAALGPDFTIPVSEPSSGRYTGRHWWGRLDDGLAEPLLDRDADDLAHALGLPGFQAKETGTTIAIVDFDPGTADEVWSSRRRSPNEAMEFMGQALLWNFWPKMIPNASGGVPICFRLSLEGRPVPVPQPAATRGSSMSTHRAARSAIRKSPRLRGSRSAEGLGLRARQPLGARRVRRVRGHAGGRRGCCSARW